MPKSSWFRPGAPDVVFGIVVFLGLVGGRSAILNDPGTYWHIELGRRIMATHSVPRCDQLTYSRAQMPWVDQSWAFDIGLASIYDRWGWSGTVVITTLILATVYGALVRGMCKDGSSPLIAGFVAVLAAAVGSIHFLARPHLFTFAFVLFTYRACKQYHERGGRAIWWVPVIIAIWANLHGGFLAGPLIVGTALIGHAVSGPWDAERKSRLRGFAAVLGASCAAPLVNPYGLGLYRHVAGLLLTSGVTKLIEEFQPPPFGASKAMVFEWFILAFVGLQCISRSRLRRYEVVHMLVWLHASLAAARQAPLFALVCAGSLARLLDGLMSPPAHPEREVKLGRWSAWPALVTVALLISVQAGVVWGKLDPKKWPTLALPVLNQQPVNARLFHEQDWGGMIEAECRPHRPTFLDDRFELFGKQAILDYMAALEGGPGWDALQQRSKFELVWVRSECGLAKRLAADPAWETVFRDKVSVLYKVKR